MEAFFFLTTFEFIYVTNQTSPMKKLFLLAMLLLFASITSSMAQCPTTSAIAGYVNACAGTAGIYSVTNNTGSTYAWTITGGTIASGAGTHSITVNWGAAGTGNVNVVETFSGGCVGAAVNSAINIVAIPVLSPVPPNLCIGRSITLSPTTGGTWYTSDPSIATITNSGVATGIGTGSVSFTYVTAVGGCPAYEPYIFVGPPRTQSISGSTIVCSNQTNVVYNYPNTVGNTYAWTITGGTLASGTGTSSITVNWGPSGSGNVSVVETTSSGCSGSPISYPVTINTPTTSAITGITNICGSPNNQVYSVTNTTGSQYSWNINGGSIISGQLTNSVIVSWSPSGGSGNLSVVETTSAGCIGNTITLPVTISTPNTSSITAGYGAPCANSSLTYSVINSSGSTYAWTAVGGTIASGGNTNSVTVNWGAAGNGTLSVVETTASGCVGYPKSYTVQLYAPPPLNSITGSTSVCINSTGTTYSVVNNNPSNYYNWIITGGTLATGNSNNSSITVNWGPNGGAGNVSVTEAVDYTVAGGCKGPAANLPVSILAPNTSAINGKTSVCNNSTGVSYSVTNTVGSTYAWSVTGGTLASGAGTNTVAVNWGAAGTGDIRVVETTAAGCTGSPLGTLVYIGSPGTSSPITGSIDACQGGNVTYSEPGNGSTYSWVVTNGTIVTNNGFYINVNWPSPGTGNIQVTETNIYGCQNAPVNLPVTIHANPAMPSIIGNSSVCTFNPTGGYSYTVSTPVSTSIYYWSYSVNGIVQPALVEYGSNPAITIGWQNPAAESVHVYELNSWECASPTANLSVNVNASPATSAISGSTLVCPVSNGVPYSVTNTPGSTYHWTIGLQAVQASGSNSHAITVNFNSTGNTMTEIDVTETNAANCVGPSSQIFVSKSPVFTSAITGNTSVCASATGVPYTVTSTSGSSYTWTITGGIQMSGGSSGSIIVNWGSTGGSGSVSVIETNSIGCIGTPVTLPVTISKPSASAISGSTTVCPGTIGSVYSVPYNSGSTYTWTITGGTQASGTNTYYITVNWGAAGTGNVSVVETATGGCSGSIINFPVTIKNVTTSAITGTTGVCASATGVSYSVTNNSGSTYAWTITGGTQASGTTTNGITVNWGAAGAGNVKVIETNSGCTGAAVNLPVTINSIPATSAITGTASVCTGSINQAYSVTNTTGSTYAWTITGGTQTGGGTNSSITVTWGAVGTGIVKVIETSAAGCVGSAVTKSVTINAFPATSAIAGNTTACPNSTGVAYSVTNTIGSTYAWTITGGSQTSGGTTNSILVTWGTGGSGNVKVIETNTAGCVGAAVNKAVTVSPLTSSIAGNTSVCANAAGVTYGVTNNTGSTYTWSVTGGSQVNGCNTGSITVNWGSAGAGSVKVTEVNSGCTGVPVNLPVTINAGATTSAITGNASVCSGSTGSAYSVTSTAGSTYVWTVVGGIQTSGTNTSSITVAWGSAGSGNISVIETTASGCVGVAVSKAVSISSLTTSPISGNTNLCVVTSAVGYSVTNTTGSTYAWNINGGTQASGTNTNSITVNWGAAGTGSVQVVETNSAGCTGTPVVLPVTINPRPLTSAITGTTTLCGSSTGISYSVPNTTGSTYTWTVAGGTQASGTNTNAITVTWGAAGAGNVNVVETTYLGCVGSTITLPVSIDTLPSVSISATAGTVCYGNSATLTATGATSYSWNTGATTAAITVTPAGATTYTVTGTTGSCSAHASYTVNVNAASGYVSPSSVNLCTATGGCALLQAGSGSGYIWTTGATSSSITVCAVGTYTVRYSLNGCSVTATANVYQGTPPPPVGSSVPDPIVDPKNGGTRVQLGDAERATALGQNLNQVPPGGVVHADQAAPCSTQQQIASMDIVEKTTFSVYPNPAFTEVTIVLTKVATEDSEVQWFDMSGRLMKSGVIGKGNTEKTFQIGELDSGIYLIRVRDGDQLRLSKMVVAK